MVKMPDFEAVLAEFAKYDKDKNRE
ncbi:hypothetical protein NVIE_2203 [Nitrososphaera viennensis EN76]|uniref:Uncharacterized protein n=1 Tax=Nitrososphaera viennensis EN76 TaxID=926571 RepID=A0A060HTK0_9ARCH|nr:hypothetical protein NVIE_2203 [Nitrososphaera viennensis EN76]